MVESSTGTSLSRPFIHKLYMVYKLDNSDLATVPLSTLTTSHQLDQTIFCSLIYIWLPWIVWGLVALSKSQIFVHSSRTASGVIGRFLCLIMAPRVLSHRTNYNKGIENIDQHPQGDGKEYEDMQNKLTVLLKDSF